MGSLPPLENKARKSSLIVRLFTSLSITIDDIKHLASEMCSKLFTDIWCVV